MIEEKEKGQIQKALQAYTGHFTSQNLASGSMTGVSNATLSHVLNENWELISDKLWRTIAAQVDYSDNPLNFSSI